MKLIHVGCHKCGSTFLQDEVFRKLANPWAVHPGHRGGFLDLLEAWFSLVYCADLYFDGPTKERTFREIRSRLESPDALLSWEGFSGGGLFLGQGYQIEFTARRLYELFPEAGVLIVIRNQRTMVESLYKDDVTYGYAVDFPEWFAWRKRYSGHEYPKFSKLIEVYQRWFGNDRVRVLLFEELFSAETFRTLFREFGIDPSGLEKVDFARRHNPSYGKISHHGALLVNRLFGSKLNLCDRESSPYRNWRWRIAPQIDRWARKRGMERLTLGFPGLEEELRALYHEDNLRTSRLIGRDLSALGYV